MTYREQIIREVANYLAPYDEKAADLALEVIASKSDDVANKELCVYVVSELLEFPDILQDAISNDKTEWDATRLVDNVLAI